MTHRLEDGQTSSEPIGCTYESANDLAEDDMFAVEPTRLAEQDEELGAVAVLAVVGHGHPARVAVTQDELLVVEAFSVDALACNNHVFCNTPCSMDRPRETTELN